MRIETPPEALTATNSHPDRIIDVARGHLTVGMV